VILDPEGRVRYAIYKKFDSPRRRARQHAAMSGPLARYWIKSGRRWKPRPNVLQRLHARR
jgi:hypothetical protein